MWRYYFSLFRTETCDSKQRLVSIIIDGDDPLNGQFDDKNKAFNEVEIVHVPINGLLDRLAEYDENGIMIDSRVYAFAIGLKKGEKLAQASIHSEPTETPI